MDFKTTVHDAFARGSRNGRIALVSTALAVFSAATAASPTSAGSSPVQEISASEVMGLKKIADANPCAATAVLLIRRMREETGQGLFQFEGIPSVHSVELMLDKIDGSVFDKWRPAMLRGPYSTARFFVEVRWSIERIDDARSVVTTHAELVDESGRPLQPRHPIEPSTKVLVSKNGYRVLDAHETPELAEQTTLVLK